VTHVVVEHPAYKHLAQPGFVDLRPIPIVCGWCSNAALLVSRKDGALRETWVRGLLGMALRSLRLSSNDAVSHGICPVCVARVKGGAA
jgi:hypothetical protein